MSEAVREGGPTVSAIALALFERERERDGGVLDMKIKNWLVGHTPAQVKEQGFAISEEAYTARSNFLLHEDRRSMQTQPHSSHRGLI